MSKRYPNLDLANLEIVKPVLDDAAAEINAQKQEVLRLKAVADQHPFYKYNGLWTRELQNLVERAVIVCDSDTLSINERWLPQQSKIRQAKWGGVPSRRKLFQTGNSMRRQSLEI